MNKRNKEQEGLQELAEKLSLEAFDQEHEAHQFSADYQTRKAKLLAQLAPVEKKPKWGRKRWLAVAAAALILIPTTVYTASEIYKWQLEQKKYELVLSLGGDKTYPHDKFYQLKLGYLPETMEEYQGPVKYSFKDDEDKAGLSFALTKINNKADFSELFTESYEEVTYGSHQGVMITKVGRTDDPNDFGRLLYLLFEEEGYVLEAYIGNTVADEDLSKVLENIQLVEVEKSEATPAMDADTIAKEKEEEQVSVPTDTLSVTATSPNIFRVGETVNLERGLAGKFTVNKVDILSRIDELPQANFNSNSVEQLINKEMLTSDGELRPFTKKFIEPGDGKDTLDEVIDEKTILPKFIYLTATIEPPTNAIIEGVFFQNHPYLIEEDGGNLTFADEFSEMSSLSWEVDYLDHHGEGNSFYQMPSFEGKKVIHFGYFVDEDQLDHLLLPVFNYGNTDENLTDLSYKWLDLRGLTEK